MRIITIRRNAEFLIKTLEGLQELHHSITEGELKKLQGVLVRIQAHIDLIVHLKRETKGQPELIRLTNLKTIVTAVVEAKQQAIDQFLAHQSHLRLQIENQCTEAIRTLLLELETAGNVRFEEEQKSSAWVAHCEKQIKKFIKRAASKDSPKTIQIHRISKFHNREMKMKFDERMETQQGIDKGTCLCFTGHPREIDIFDMAENGFDIKSGLIMTNYFECHESKDTQKKAQLRKVVIFKTFKMATQEVSEQMNSQEFENIAAYDFPAAEAIYQKVFATPESRQAIPAEIPKNYRVFDASCLLPEYLVEYSLESDFDSQYTPSERLLLDIAYSNRIAHANMPAVVVELLSKLKQQPINSIADTPTLAKVMASHSDLSEFADLKLFSSKYASLLKASETRDEYLNLSGFTSVASEYFAMRNILKSVVINCANLSSFPNFPVMLSMERLDLSFNTISEVPSRIHTQFPKLKTLCLASNNLESIADVKRIMECSKLVELDIRYNGIAKIRNVDDLIKSRLNLEAFNGQKIFEKRVPVTNWDSLFRKSISNQSECFRPFSLRTLQGIDSSSLEQNYYLQVPSVLSDSIAFDQITAMELDSCSLLGLDKLPEQ
jgi:hypothetical protein